MRLLLLSVVALLGFLNPVFSQSLIINEVSQGPTGVKEYVELLVIPSLNPVPCTPATLDLRNWILDDNNGYFSNGPSSGEGIASGCLRFANSTFWSAIPVGTLIVVYNDADVNSAIPPQDLSTTDNNCRLVIPVSSTLFDKNLSTPSVSVQTIPTTGYSPGGIWSAVGMANTDDSFAIYSASNYNVPVHGVSWGNNTSNNIIYFAGAATNLVFSFTNNGSNNPYLQSNWSSATTTAANGQTPGAGNNTDNQGYISFINNNCSPYQPILPYLSNQIGANCICNGTATSNAVGGSAYTYVWMDNNQMPIGQTSATASNLCPGIYYCQVTSANGCSAIDSVEVMDVTVQVMPTFNSYGPYCLNTPGITLPTTSNNGITGTWLPAQIQTTSLGTATYIFTPTPGQCANSVALSVTTSTLVPTTFNLVDTYCVGTQAAALPSSSLNGISGTWSPAVINTSAVGTQILTFTPVNTSCGAPSTWYVDIVSNITPTFDPIGLLCVGSPAPTLPLNSNNAMSGVWSPTQINTSFSNSQDFIFTPDPGQCGVPIQITVDVNDSITPSFWIFGTYCINEVPMSLPNQSMNNISGTWFPPVINTAVQGISYYTFNSIGGACETDLTVNVVITDSIVPTFPNFGPYCLGAAVPNLPLNSNDGISGTWSPSQLSSAVAGNFTYIFTPVQSACTSTATLYVSVQQLTVGAGNDTTVCAGTSLTFAGTGANSYVWTNGIQDNVPFQANTTSNYTVTGTTNNCTATDQVLVTVIPMPTAQFTGVVTNYNVLLSNSSLNGTQYSWYFGDGGSTSSMILGDQSYTYQQGGVYEIMLVTSNSFCIDTAYFTVTVMPEIPFDVTYPNVFTPNDDSNNDSYSLDFEGMADFEAIILNRWGELMTTLTPLNPSWDGKFNQKECAEGVYFMKFTALGMNGLSYDGQQFLHLIR